MKEFVVVINNERDKRLADAYRSCTCVARNSLYIYDRSVGYAVKPTRRNLTILYASIDADAPVIDGPIRSTGTGTCI